VPSGQYPPWHAPGHTGGGGSPPRSSDAARVGPVGSTRPHRQSPAPRLAGDAPSVSGGPDGFFSEVCRVGVGQPGLGTLPADAQRGKGSAAGFVADAPACQPLLTTDLGRQCQGPQTGRLAASAWTLGSEPPEPCETVGIEDGWGRVRSGGLGLEHSEATAMTIVDGMAYSLIVAPEGASHSSSMLPFGTRQEARTTANGQTPGGPQPSFQGHPFVGRQRSNKKWCLHKGEDTT